MRSIFLVIALLFPMSVVAADDCPECSGKKSVKDVVKKVSKSVVWKCGDKSHTRNWSISFSHHKNWLKCWKHKKAEWKLHFHKVCKKDCEPSKEK